MDGKALAQIWYMHEGEGEKNNDGRHIDYFERIMGSVMHTWNTHYKALS